MTQWQGPSLEGFVGLLLLLFGLPIVGDDIAGSKGGAAGLIGFLIVYFVFQRLLWKKHPSLSNRASWPAYWSALWRMLLVGLGVLLLLGLVETVLRISGIESGPYDFVEGIVLVALGTGLEIIGRRKPPFGLKST